MDGKEHYSDNDRAARYAEMVAEDRRIPLAGYEMYRFAGIEMTRPDAKDVVRPFLNELLADGR